MLFPFIVFCTIFVIVLRKGRRKQRPGSTHKKISYKKIFKEFTKNRNIDSHFPDTDKKATLRIRKYYVNVYDDSNLMAETK